MCPAWTSLVGVALCLLGLAAAHAQPFVPARDDEVVERLPLRMDAAQRARKAQLMRDPRHLALAVQTAQDAVLRARREGDPRELGSAQAALAPWWQEKQAPAPVRLLRATIRQSQHDFEAALADLDALVDASHTPLGLRAQALLTRASLHQLQGRLAASRSDCLALQQPAYAALGADVQRLARACEAELRSLSGEAPEAVRVLDTLAAGPGAIGAAGPAPWIALLRAELAERQGDDAAARHHYEAAVAAGEVYALAAYADWLLDRGRAREALALLVRGPEQADALLLRRAIAWQRLGDARAATAATALRERFAAVRLRGDHPHLREEARLALDIDRDATRALALAREQWRLQKEPADAVLLWRAARAAGQPEAATALHGWLPDPARADVRLAGLPPERGAKP